MAKGTNKPATTAKPATEAPKYNAAITKAIKIIAEFQPHVKVAYFNQAGEYHFHPRKGFKAVNIDGTEEEEIDLTAGGELNEPELSEEELAAIQAAANGGKTEF